MHGVKTTFGLGGNTRGDRLAIGVWHNRQARANIKVGVDERLNIINGLDLHVSLRT